MDKDTPMVKKLDKNQIKFSRLKRRILRHTWVVRLGLISIALILLYVSFATAVLLFKQTGAISYTKALTYFIFTPKGAVQSFEGKTNILILGKGGLGHDAPDLTDALVFASLDHKTMSLTTISVPRDIWISELRTKLNSIYYWGNQRATRGGLTLSKSTVEQIIGQPVHYALVLDFSVFQKLIDILDGVEVSVETSFMDEKYPIAGKEDDECGGDPDFKCRYTTVSFESGEQVMDGITALTFVRSRNAEGDEGTDLARSARQQKVLSAIKTKTLSTATILSPRKLILILNIFADSIETDISLEESAYMARIIASSREDISSNILPEDLLFNPSPTSRYDNLYVFVPSSGDWLEVQQWVREKLNQ